MTIANTLPPSRGGLLNIDSSSLITVYGPSGAGFVRLSYATRGMTWVQKRSIDFISTACGTRLL